MHTISRYLKSRISRSISEKTCWQHTPLYEHGFKLPILRIVMFPTIEGTAETRANRYPLKIMKCILRLKDQKRRNQNLWGIEKKTDEAKATAVESGVLQARSKEEMDANFKRNARGIVAPGGCHYQRTTFSPQITTRGQLLLPLQPLCEKSNSWQIKNWIPRKYYALW